ncbi:MAG: UDP-N-acetylglucosamine 1-carboxyvinyltransferase [Frankiaceae bacterium]|jgi:UDP-N-acetylglucosamine 1-carboxyvinyltransferase|nr:UDP-N-acetylglucosamine 1-carboxyvinyltransferase [Frankiaceae bacterium]
MTWTVPPAEYHRRVEILRVAGPARLAGEVPVVGAKNSVLKLMSAALLAPGVTHIDNLPAIADVAVMRELLEHLGCAVSGVVSSDGTEGVAIDVPDRVESVAPYELVRRIRASICVLGPLLTRTGEARVAMPGGDNIGSRKLDMHMLGLQRLGASVEVEHGFIIAKAARLQGARIWLDFPSVGATENLLTAAVLARGATVIDNAAREPEIADLCRMLIAMGARIDGVGTSTLEIDGVDELSPVRHAAVADRIVAGTWAFAATITQGDIRVRGADAGHRSIALDKLAHAGASVIEAPDGFRVIMDRRPQAFDVVTLPYPGFPTDLQPQAIALLSVAEGAAMITENLFDGRFMFCDELVRMGADLRTDGHHALVRGRPALSAAPVRATDIRAGVGLVLAALAADGVSEIGEIHHIDRGYVRFEEQLRGLGAEVDRVESELFGS